MSDLAELTMEWMAAKEAEKQAREARGRIEQRIHDALKNLNLERAWTPCATVALKPRYAWHADAGTLLRPALEYLSPQDRGRFIERIEIWKVSGVIANKLLRQGGQPAEIVESARALMSYELEVTPEKVGSG